MTPIEKLKDTISNCIQECMQEYYADVEMHIIKTRYETIINSAVETLIGWHDVTKEMPDDEEQVITYVENGNTNIDWIDKDTGEFINGVTKKQVEDVTNKFGPSPVTDKMYRIMKSGNFITHWRKQIPGVDWPV